MDALRHACLKVPEQHPAKLAHEEYPCGGKIIRTLAFVNAPKSLREFIELSFSRVDPNLPFLIFNEETLSYGDVYVRVCALATSLVHDFGVGFGDAVAISARNYPEWCLAFLAAACAGAVVVPINSWWKESEMAYGLKDSKTKVFFCDVERLTYASSALKRLGIREYMFALPRLNIFVH